MKQKNIAVLITLIFGAFGFHWYYLEKNTKGIFYTIFCWTLIPFLLSIYDFFKLISLDKDKFNKLYNQ